MGFSPVEKIEVVFVKPEGVQCLTNRIIPKGSLRDRMYKSATQQTIIRITKAGIIKILLDILIPCYGKRKK